MGAVFTFCRMPLCACSRCSSFAEQAYRDILDGRWEDWDPFKAGPRIRAVDYPALSHGPGRGGGLDGMGLLPESRGEVLPQAFRPFQGYLSFGRWGDVGNVSFFSSIIVDTGLMWFLLLSWV